MFSYLPLILAAGSLSTLSLGAPIVTPSSLYSKRATANTYTVYGGDGSTSDGWPTSTEWISTFDDMFSDNTAVMQASCANFGVTNNSDDEMTDLKAAISEVASTTGVDSRFILAIVMQESNGCVRVPTTSYSVSNPGLMQSHAGTGTCNDGTTVQNPCPKSEMVQMITDGTAGTSSGDGLKQCLAAAGTTDVSMYYKAARIYNSGSIDGDNLGAGDATACYCTDIANRLTGWYSGTSACVASTIATLTGPGSSIGSAISAVSSAIETLLPSSIALPTIAMSSYAIPTTSSSVYVAPTSSAYAYVTPSTPAYSSPAAYAYIATSAAASAASIVVEPFYTNSVANAPSSSSISISSTQVSGAASAEITSSSSVVAIPTLATTSISVIVPSVATVSSAIYTPSATGTAPSLPLSTGTSSSTTYAAGTSCSTPGEWNCVSSSGAAIGDSFQQCSSGTWSVVSELSAGTQCTLGQSSAIDIFGSTSTKSKLKPRSVRKVTMRRGGKFESRTIPIAG